MGSLTTLRVNYSNVIEFAEKLTQDIPWTQWELRLGGTTVLLIARGDCYLGTDLRSAKYEQVSAADKTATLSLPTPIQELHDFLMEDRDGAEAMMLDTMDGFLHAVAIGPITLKPQQWLPPIWGHTEEQGMMPAMQSLDQLNRILELVMRHFNSIVAGLEDEPPDIYPRWNVREWEGRELDDAEGWAWGFVQGVDLCRSEWDPLLQTPQGQAWYRPIGLLGEDDFGPEQDNLTRTPSQRAELSLQIPQAVIGMHAHWLPLRRAVYERTAA
ncbi:MAG: YecA family protein [Betaproteobacteria bacterium]|nr:YecA family protein [Betaproteobacteria bacterium]